MACAYEDSTILVGVNSSLPHLAPDVVEFLRQWDFSIDVHLRNVVRWLDGNPGSSVEDAALHWLGSNVGIWSGWVTGEAAAGIRATLPAMDEDGTVTLSSMQPVVGTALTASLSDPGGMVTGEMWQWARSMDMMDWEDIAGATMASYTPVGSDAGYYLRATVTYTDGEGPGKEAMQATAYMVIAGDPLLAEYDPDNDGMIEKEDMRRAVADYFGSSPTLTRADMRRLVSIYFQ